MNQFKPRASLKVSVLLFLIHLCWESELINEHATNFVFTLRLYLSTIWDSAHGVSMSRPSILMAPTSIVHAGADGSTGTVGMDWRVSLSFLVNLFLSLLGQ